MSDQSEPEPINLRDIANKYVGVPRPGYTHEDRRREVEELVAAIQQHTAAAVAEAAVAARIHEWEQIAWADDISDEIKDALAPHWKRRLAELLARQAADKGLREDTCQLCGLPNPVWFAPSELWNKVMRDPDEGDKYQFICPRCFAFEAEAVGITPTGWVLQVEGIRG